MDTLDVICWGTTGSWPSGSSEALKFKRSKYGGQTSCYEITGEAPILLDAGSGIRNAGKSLLTRRFDPSQHDIHLLVSHYHNDHIGGIGSFPLIFNPATTLHIYGPVLDDRLTGNLQEPKTAISDMIGGRYFPGTIEAVGLEPENGHYRIVTLSHDGRKQYGGRILFYDISGGTVFTVGNATLKMRLAPHSSAGVATYRIEIDGKTIVYQTDTELNALPERRDAMLELAQSADILMVDGQYTSGQKIRGQNSTKYTPGWGHNTINDAATFGIEAHAQNIVIVHHDPNHSDSVLNQLERTLGRYVHEKSTGTSRLTLAKEGRNILT